MTSVKIKTRCLVCGFEVEWFAYVNENGFFAISDAYCPNDFTMMEQIIDGRSYEDLKEDKKR